MFSVQAKNEDHLTIAQGSEQEQSVLVLENNWYFTPEKVNMEVLTVTGRTYTCPYKGICYWIDLNTPDMQVRNIGWVYHDPKPGYEMIKGRIGFYARETSGTLAQIS